MHMNLNLRVIGDSVRVFSVHPGRGRRFFDTFSERSIAYLELPDLGLRPADFGSVEKVRKRVRRVMARMDYLRDPVNNEQPSDTLDDYEGGPVSDRRHSSQLGNVVNLFSTAQDGDIIVTPNSGHYRPMLLGEFKGPFTPEDHGRVPQFEHAEVEFRKVRWLNKDISLQDLESKLAQRVVNQHAVVEHRRDETIDQIFRHLYPAYILGDHAYVEFDGPGYRGRSLMETVPSAELIMFFIVAHKSMTESNSLFIQEKSIRQIVEDYLDAGGEHDFKQNFNSPGKFILTSASVGAVLFAIIGTTLALSPGGLDNIDRDLTVSVGGMLENQSPELAAERDRVRHLRNALGAQRIGEIDELGERSASTVGLTTPAELKQ